MSTPAPRRRSGPAAGAERAPNFLEIRHDPASRHGWRYKLYRLLFHHDAPAERNTDLLLIAAILAGVAIVMLDSVPAIKARWHDALYIAEWVVTLLFTVEYGIRMWVVKRPMRYATSVLGVIDLLAIVPTFLSLLFPASTSLAVVRILRLLRIFRILKLANYSSEAGVLLDALWRSRRKIFVFVATLLTITVIFGALMYVIEGPDRNFNSIPTGMYWAVVTMATLGYGDITPATTLGRFITSTLVVIGYSIIAVPTGIYTAELAKAMQKARRRVRCTECGLPDHEADAWHCRQCGRALPGSDD